jgi:hypothetical protein
LLPACFNPKYVEGLACSPDQHLCPPDQTCAGDGHCYFKTLVTGGTSGGGAGSSGAGGGSAGSSGAGGSAGMGGIGAGGIGLGGSGGIGVGGSGGAPVCTTVVSLLQAATFSTKVSATDVAGPVGMALVDADLDTNLDLVVANQLSSEVVVLAQHPLTCTPFCAPTSARTQALTAQPRMLLGDASLNSLTQTGVLVSSNTNVVYRITYTTVVGPSLSMITVAHPQNDLAIATVAGAPTLFYSFSQTATTGGGIDYLPLAGGTPISLLGAQSPTTFAIGPFYGPGQDVVASDSDADTDLWNQTNGTYGSFTQGPPHADALVGADVDGAGEHEIIAIDNAANAVTIANRGDQTFLVRATLAAASPSPSASMIALAVGTLHDGGTNPNDIAVLFSDGTVEVFLNQSTAGNISFDCGTRYTLRAGKPEQILIGSVSKAHPHTVLVSDSQNNTVSALFLP